MTSDEYMSDVQCFRTIASMRDEIYYKQHTTYKSPSSIHSIIQPVKTKKQAVLLTDYKTDKSVILAIQNDVRFINIIMNCRKQKSPIAHIFVESNLYVSCVIKNANGYPLMLIRIPIDGVYAYAINTSNTYEFPIQGILSKDIKYTKNSSYSMTFNYDGQNVRFIYTLYNGEVEPNRIIIDNIATSNQSVINNIFKIDRFSIMLNDDSMTALQPLMANDYNEDENYMLAFYNMNVLVIKEVQDPLSVIQFTQKSTAGTQNYFEIKEGKMIFVSSTAKNHNEKYICSVEDALMWNLPNKDDRYDIMPYESLFKTNYNKSITSNDKVFYIFTSYLDSYLFIKIITPLDITLEQTITFNKLFFKDYQIIECYACIKRQ